MDPVLPDQPDLEFEKKRAKALLKAARAGEPEAVARLGPAPTLADAQHAVARERGFADWPRLKAHIESLRPLAEQVVPFLTAALDRKAGVVQRLLSRHPELATYDIHTASAAGNPDAVAGRLALDRVAATAPHPVTGIPPIVYAAATPVHRSGPMPAAAVLRCVRELLDAGADPNSAVPWGEEQSPVPALYYACVDGNAAVARLLLERGARVDDGESLHHAAEEGRLDCLDVLLEYGVDLNARGSRWDKTVLYFLAQSDGQPSGVTWLLEHGADPDIPSGDVEETPLHRVAETGNRELADLLVRHGAGLDLARADGRTAYVVAARAGNEEIARLLADAGASTAGITARDELLAACLRGDESAAREVLAGSELRPPFPPEDAGMLVHAAMLDRSDAVRVMAAVGFDLAVEAHEGGTALHWAAWWGRAETVSALIELGAPLDLRDARFGSSPLGWAAHGSRHCRSADPDYLRVVDALLDAGADRIASENRWGEPAADLASRAVRRRLIDGDR